MPTDPLYDFGGGEWDGLTIRSHFVLEWSLSATRGAHSGEFLTEVFLYARDDGRVPIVLNEIVGAAHKQLGKVGPLIAQVDMSLGGRGGEDGVRGALHGVCVYVIQRSTVRAHRTIVRNCDSIMNTDNIQTKHGHIHV